MRHLDRGLIDGRFFVRARAFEGVSKRRLSDIVLGEKIFYKVVEHMLWQIFRHMSPTSWKLARVLQRAMETGRCAIALGLSKGRSNFRDSALRREQSRVVSSEDQGLLITVLHFVGAPSIDEKCGLERYLCPCRPSPSRLADCDCRTLHPYAIASSKLENLARRAEEAGLRRFMREAVESSFSQMVAYGRWWRLVTRSKLFVS